VVGTNRSVSQDRLRLKFVGHPADPTLRTTKKLCLLSNNICAFRDPDRLTACENRLIEPSYDNAVAHICHIRGKKPGSARYDPSMTDEERRHFDNLVILCPTCSTLIDYGEPQRFTVPIVTKMKLDALKNPVDPDTWSAATRIEQMVNSLISISEWRDRAGPLQSETARNITLSDAGRGTDSVSVASDESLTEDRAVGVGLPRVHDESLTEDRAVGVGLPRVHDESLTEDRAVGVGSPGVGGYGTVPFGGGNIEMDASHTAPQPNVASAHIEIDASQQGSLEVQAASGINRIMGIGAVKQSSSDGRAVRVQVNRMWGDRDKSLIGELAAEMGMTIELEYGDEIWDSAPGLHRGPQ
jgi:hypothetical protein